MGVYNRDFPRVRAYFKFVPCHSVHKTKQRKIVTFPQYKHDIVFFLDKLIHLFLSTIFRVGALCCGKGEGDLMFLI